MADLLALSARIIDSGQVDQPVNRVTQELSEVADGIAVIESFSHSVVVRTDDGLVVSDTSGVATGAAVVDAVRSWSAAPVDTVIYTHGHLDHVGGSGAFAADAVAAGHERPTFVAHRAVPERLDRYRLTDSFNQAINHRQFGWIAGRGMGIGGERGAGGRPFLPDDVVVPDVTYDRTHRLDVGGVRVELRHARGETDDHTWAWLPGARAVCSGDFLIWNFPNAGNPQKVQRYPDRWAAALREMVALEPELLLPAHGLPIAGRERIALVLGDVAGTLEHLVADVVAMMNGDATLDEIIHTVRVDPDTLARPYLRPLYDEPEFVVRNIWRLYGGWWDGNPARLKPPPDATVATEVAALAGGPLALADRAEAVAAGGDIRLACQLMEWAAAAGAVEDEPASELAERRRALYRLRSDEETSLMAKGIFRSVRG